MRKIIPVSVLGLAVAVGTLTAPAPAQATPTEVRVHAQATGVDVRRGHCADAELTGYGNWGEFADATVDIVVMAPDGSTFREIDFADSTGTYDRAINICYGAATGNYAVEVTVTAHDSDGAEYVGSDDATFGVHHVIPKKRSRIAVRTGRIQPQGPYRFGALGTLFRASKKYAGQKVWLLAHSSDGWLKIDSARTRAGRHRGQVLWIFKPNSIRWALWYGGDDRTKTSSSDVFRFPSSRPTATPQRVAALRSLVTRAR